MSESQKKASPVSPLKEGEGRPESPTTAQPLDFDDDQDTATPIRATPRDDAPKPPPKDETASTKPARPLSAREQAENTLKEAFPTIDLSVIKAVLTASGGQVEPAFNALLSMTDPDAAREPEPEPEPQPPARPPRPQRNTPTQKTQLEADEEYARQLHEHYANAERSRTENQNFAYNENLQGSRIGRPGNVPNPDEPVKWRSFIDDDLPEIRDNIKKGFFETQKTVNSWITNFKKQLDGEEEDEYSQGPPKPPRPGQQNQYGSDQFSGRRSGEARRSADMARYDADPQVIGDDFSKLDFRDGDHPPRTSSRPLANPNLFRPGSSEATRRPSPGGGRKVSFQDGPPEEIRDMYNSPAPSKTTTTIDTSAPTGGKASKWQPLAKVDPSPVTENDPFSLGDSDDEKDAKPIVMKDDEEDRLQKATDEAMKDSIGASTKSDGKK